MAGRIAKYALAAVFPAAVAGAAFGPRHCTEVFGCMGGHSTAQAWLLVVLLGAAVGALAMAVVDVAANARYALANRAEARRRRAQDPSTDRP